MRKIQHQRSDGPPGKLICWLVAFVEMAVVLTIAMGAFSASYSSSVITDTSSLSGDGGETMSKPDAEQDQDEQNVPPRDSDADFSGRMLGTWEDDYKGHRILTLRPDGTGTMIVELDGITAMLFAKSLTFQEEWVVDNRRVTMRAVSGEPAGKVNLILSLHGDSSIQKIVEVTADRMILVEEPSGTRFEWRRVPVVETTALPGVSPDSSGR